MQPSAVRAETALPDFTENSVALRGEWIARLTPAEFETFCLQSAHQRHRIERPFADCLLVSPPQGVEASQWNHVVGGQLAEWNEVRHLGSCSGSNTNFCLAGGAVLSPDVAWLSAARWQGLTDAERLGFPRVPPTFIVEIASWGESLPWLREKMDIWRSNGVRLGWLISPETETVLVYREGRFGYETVQGFDGHLSGEPVLPGFTLDLRALRAVSS